MLPCGRSVPGSLGGANWAGGSYDPDTHAMYVFSQTALTVMGLIQPDPKVSDMNYIRGTAGVTPQVRKIGDPPP